jgi:phosphoglycolate phosphatase
MSNPRPELVLFDLDGTLADTVAEVTLAVNQALSEEGLPGVTRLQVSHWMGKGTAWFMAQAINASARQETNEDLFQKLYPRFLDYYAAVTGQAATLYPGARETLTALVKNGFRLGVVTNKDRSLTVKLLEALQLSHHFEVLVAGGDAPRGKPSPDPLLLALKQAGTEAPQALFVGDSQNDVQAARAAGIAVWAFEHGYNHGEPIQTANPDEVLADYNHLARALGVTPAPLEQPIQ